METYQFDGISSLDEFMPPPLPESTFAEAFTSPTSKGSHRPRGIVIPRSERVLEERIDMPTELSDAVRASECVTRQGPPNSVLQLP